MPRKEFPTNWTAGGTETECGSGSMVQNMGPVIKYLPRVLNMINPNLQPIMELGCGDLNFAANAIFNHHAAPYWGMDIKRRESWAHHEQCWPGKLRLAEHDITDPKLGFAAYAIIVRDVFIHLPNKTIQGILSRMDCKYLISTTYTDASNARRDSQPNAEFQPLNLHRAPFNLTPELFIQEHASNKLLGVYEL